MMCYNVRTGALNRRRRGKTSKVFSGGWPEGLAIRHANFKLHFPLIFLIIITEASVIIVIEPRRVSVIDVTERANALEVFHHLSDDFAILVDDNINSTPAIERVFTIISNVLATLGEISQGENYFIVGLIGVVTSDSVFFSHHF
jgi:hypothetical protein